jgi:hypothetical protein
MSNLQARGGSVRVRIGGNTQETATMVGGLSDGKMMEKGRPTDYPVCLYFFHSSCAYYVPQMEMSTPPLLYTPEVVYMLANISSLVNVQWYLGGYLEFNCIFPEMTGSVGIPLNDTQHLRLKIAEVAERVLGNNLLGLQVGNEPDQYGM